MPRKVKYGLEYYSKDVLFYEEIDTQKLLIYGGAEAGIIYEILLSKIYQSGHFFRFNDFTDDLIFLFKKNYHFDEKKIRHAFDVILKYGFFDKASFDKGYLTSLDIQRFYYQITKGRRDPYIDECWLLNEDEMVFIETPKKKRTTNIQSKKENALHEKSTTVVYQSTSEQEESSTEVGNSTQSKSHTKTQSKTKKREKIKEKGDSPQIIIPSHYDGYLRTMIKQKLIEVFDINNEKINNLLIECRSNIDSTVLYDAVRYTINQLHKNNWKDGKGKMVVDKYNYFNKALQLNLDRVQKNDDFQNDPRTTEEKIFSNLSNFKKKKNLD